MSLLVLEHLFTEVLPQKILNMKFTVVVMTAYCYFCNGTYK